MPIAVNLGNPSFTNKKSKLVVSVVKDKRPTYVFEPNDFIIDDVDDIAIELAEGATFEGISEMDLFSYCTTDLDMEKVRATYTGDSNGNQNEVTDQDAPFGKGTSSITFQMHLAKRQLVFIGVIIRIHRNNKDEYFLCDPQVGNGPPGAGDKLYATPL